ncbi:hypothetical protein PFICI_15257 [Pestalotiopsis fici W106-1]|uniref:F-box domain-containing protein n=1 Tax=Pestalotiopsis fici (strain W106-1 / CGMCC3.15140) TaxID=1229662 RepID=W3WIU2_PESFW|nr:uncharacterized protein PFICI_15257 [Pestalotiopsis fici W106-1]ETS73082.1 hypothetical protein PFICI_15257 [Pestalotiopsis fici W106-1]
MAPVATLHTTRASSDLPDLNLFDLLSNSLILHEIVPFLPISALLNLSASSRTLRNLLYDTPGVFRYVDLSSCKSATFDIAGIDRGGEVWRNVQLDENVTEDEFYSGPLRGILYNLQRTNVLQNVHTLVLDGLSVTADLVHEILVDPKYQVRILSVRGTRNLNERRLMQTLRYACRPGRPEGTPRLKGLYVFGTKDLPSISPAVSKASPPPVASPNISINWNHKSSHALKESMNLSGSDWYHRRGKVSTKPIAVDGWAATMLDCRGAIQFDACLCTGPRHQNSVAFGKVPVASVPGANHPWNIATFALGGCATCGCAPEGFTSYSDSPFEQLPLLAPVPLHSSSVKTACRPESTSKDGSNAAKFVPRCWDCVRDRFCFSCLQWWCEACYQAPTSAELQAAQHVHIVQDSNEAADYEVLQQMEALKIKVRDHTCIECQVLKEQTWPSLLHLNPS